ncbi:MAG: GerMN domain-containing protein [Candidatus Eiseniibacteriota bacterium]
MNVDLKELLRRGIAIIGRTALVITILAVVAAGLAIWYFRTREAKPGFETGDVALPRGTRAIELYFPDARGQDLLLETREVVEESVEGEALVRTVVSELLRGPEGHDARPVFPDGVTLAHVYRDPGGGLYLDFSTRLRSGFRGGSTTEILLVSSLLRTLAANVPGVNRVSITAGGQSLPTLGGHLRLDGPLIVSEWR